MKKLLPLFACAFLCFTGKTWAQIYNPISVTGYNLDAVAEAQPATSTTGGPIDGSNYVLYSYAYGQLYATTATGLPNSGVVTNGNRNYQMEAYTQNNMLYLPTLQMDSLTLSTPAQYPTISLLAFATEGNATMTVKLRFTDGSSQLFTSVNLNDWYTAATNTVLVGFDRCSRPLGTPNYATGTTPQMFSVDLNLDCINRFKPLQRVIIQNTSVSPNPRLCIMAVAGGIAPSFTVNTTPVTCANGTNGTATITSTGGVPPYTYTWSTTPPQTGSIVLTLPTGTVNYSLSDAAGCITSTSVIITQALVTQPPLVVNASTNPICIGGTVVLSTSGASTYTWSNAGSGATTTITPANTGTYSVVGTTTANCTLNGSLNITVNPLPVLTFTSVPDRLCLNAGGIPLIANPTGGTFTGPGLSFGSFFPSLAGVGTQTIDYSYTDANGCTSNTTISTIVASNTVVIGFTLTPSSICVSSPSFAMNATPAGGTYTGQGVVGSAFSPSMAGLGTRTVSYTYTDANNCSAKKVASISVTACATATFTGLQELSASNIDFELYPNPNSGSFHLKAGADLDLAVVNELGQTVQTISLTAFNNHEVYVENLAPGIYFLKAQDYIIKQKIIVASHQ